MKRYYIVFFLASMGFRADGKMFNFAGFNDFANAAGKYMFVSAAQSALIEGGLQGAGVVCSRSDNWPLGLFCGSVGIGSAYLLGFFRDGTRSLNYTGNVGDEVSFKNTTGTGSNTYTLSHKKAFADMVVNYAILKGSWEWYRQTGNPSCLLLGGVLLTVKSGVSVIS